MQLPDAITTKVDATCPRFKRATTTPINKNNDQQPTNNQQQRQQREKCVVHKRNRNETNNK